ncbi:MAG: hypothetical protein AABY13_02900 [Nanoarchaeota archaeon]
MARRRMVSYVLDFIYGATTYPSGWIKPGVVRGYFAKTEDGHHQRLFFSHLLKLGFKRTHWQLVLPGQTAGLVKKIPPNAEGLDQYHVRFYKDGRIDCEVEVNCFSSMHWVGPRKHCIEPLEEMLGFMTGISEHEKDVISRQFVVDNHHAHKCIRKVHG